MLPFTTNKWISKGFGMRIHYVYSKPIKELRCDCQCERETRKKAPARKYDAMIFFVWSIGSLFKENSSKGIRLLSSFSFYWVFHISKSIQNKTNIFVIYK